MIRLTSEDESVKLMEITENSCKHSGFDSMSPSCEEIINVQDIVDRHNLLSNPLRPVYGTESIVHRRKISWYPSYSLFIDGQFIMKAHAQIKNCARSYLLSTCRGLKPNEKADILLGEVRATSDTNFVLYSLCEMQENRELVAIMQDKPKSER